MNQQPDTITYEEVCEVVRRDMDHPFLRQHQISRHVSRFHFDVLQAILRAAGVAVAEARQVIYAVLILHQGLSIHDHVAEEAGMRRQLAVLAGDFDSSLYYRLLAQVGNQALLRALCKAVVAINEAKTLLSMNSETMSSEAFWRCQETVQGDLLMAVASEYLTFNESTLILFRALIRVYVISEYAKLRLIPKQIPLRQSLTWMAESADWLLRAPSNHIVEPIMSFIMEYVQTLRSSVERLTWAEGIH